MAVKFQDYYQTLGVKRDASTDEIRRAFRKLARLYHPDVSKAPQAAEKFKQANEAYEVLGDPEKRQRYDQLGADWKTGQDFRPPPDWENMDFEFRGADGGRGFSFKPGGQFSDFFETFFGRVGGAGGQQGGRGRADGGGGAESMFEEMFGGGGRGAGPRAGARPQAVQSEISITLEEAARGTTRRLTLQGPDGQRTLDVDVPAGVTNGSKLRLKGQGGPGVDVMLKVNISTHPRFTVRGHDLTTPLPVSPWEAALGAKVNVPTLDGDVTMTLPAGTPSGRKLRLKGRGMPKRGAKGKDAERGDLFAEVRLVVPESLSDEERELFENLREASTFDPRG